MNKFEIIHQGKENGVNTVLRYKTARGTEIYAMGVPVSYEAEGDWGLGPTWCYVIRKDPVTLIDTGQWGKYDSFKELLAKTGIPLSEIKRVIISHAHEDHDGNLPEVVADSGAEVWGHATFASMISYHTSLDGNPMHPDYPGSCRTCLMPDTFNVACIPYHEKRSRIKNLHRIGNGDGSWGSDYRFLSTPGHSPDSICVLFEGEVFFSGDTLLPSITPHPSLALEFYAQQSILPEGYREIGKSYGLMTYVSSLRRIVKDYAGTRILLPAHRLLERGELHYLNPMARAAEIIDFHEDRCDKIMNILADRILSPYGIAIELFDERMCKGYGRYLSQREVIAHLELMAIYGDIEWVDGTSFNSRRTGSDNYRKFFQRRDQ